MSGGAIAALAAVVVVALVATGAGVFLVTRGDDPGAAPTTTAASTAPSTEAADTDTPTTAGASDAPATSDAADTSDGSSDTTSAADDFFPLPDGDGLPGNVPDQLPRPEGATPAAIGFEVDMPIDAVVAFYRSALPPEGYTVGDAPSSLTTGQTLSVEGNGVTGQLVIAVVGGPETSVLWIPG